MDILQAISIIICTLAFSAASYTRVKSEVQVLYRPPCSSYSLFTGPRYLSSQARVSLMYSFRGGMWSVS